jgi:hypothetical protein
MRDGHFLVLILGDDYTAPMSFWPDVIIQGDEEEATGWIVANYQKTLHRLYRQIYYRGQLM